jgi:glycosyltransferase involved in cell wall biosynthesis
MRVLSLSQLLMPDSTGGTGRVARSLCNAMVRNGEQVVALTQRVAAKDPAYACTGGLEIYRFGAPQLRVLMGMSLSTRLGMPIPLRELLRRQVFAGAIGHQPASSLAAAPALRRHGIPELRFFHASGAQETTRNLAPASRAHLRYFTQRKVLRDLRLSELWRMERAYVRGAERLCFLSRYAQEWAIRLHGPDLPPSTIIPAGVDTSTVFRPAVDRLAVRRLVGAGAEDVILFTARHLAPRMGLDTLLRAIPALLHYDPAIRVVIAGQGAMRAELEQLAAALGIAEKVLFLGYVPDRVLVSWYQACDLFVLPTVAMEGFGMVTAEAMACGAPVVGTPVGATPELLSGLHPYLLARSASAEDLTAAILRVLQWCDLDLLRAEVRAHALRRFDVTL